MSLLTKVLKFVIAMAVVLSLCPSIVLAQAATAVQPQQEWWQALLAWLLPIVGSIVTAVVGALLGALLRRWNISIQQELIDKAIGTGVNYAEGKAMARLNTGASKTPGSEKMTMALEVAGKLIEQYKLKQLAEVKLKELIEAKVGAAKVEEKKALLRGVVAIGDKAAPVIKIPGWAQ